MRSRSALFTIAACGVLPLVMVVPPASGQSKDSAWDVVRSPGDVAELSDTSFVNAGDGWAVGSTGESLSGSGLDPLIEHWNGTAWRVSDSLVVPNSDEVLTGVVAIDADDAWAVGWQDPYGTGRVRALLVHWDGTRWTETSGAPGAGIPTAVSATSSDDVWAVGLGLTEHFDGTAWSLVQPPRNDVDLRAVTMFASDDAWAVGSRPIRKPGYHSGKPYVAHWDGAQWHRSPLPRFTSIGGLAGVSGTGPSDVWAVGGVGSRSQAPYALHFDGHRWTHVSTPTARESSSFSGVTSVSPTDVWAVGSQHGHLKSGFAVLRTFTEHWDGSSWTIVSSRNDSRQDDWLAAVRATSDAVWAFGGDGGTLVERHPL